MASASLSKLITIVAVFVIVASVNAQFDNPREMCRHEIQECEMHSCKWYLMQRGRDMLLSFTNQGMRERCCMELRDISPQCRCNAIEEMVKGTQEDGGGTELTRRSYEQEDDGDG